MGGSVHLIHIGDTEQRLRAIELFVDVPETWMSFPGHVFGVTGKHIDALQKANPPVKFDNAKKEHLNGQKTAV